MDLIDTAPFIVFLYFFYFVFVWRFKLTPLFQICDMDVLKSMKK